MESRAGIPVVFEDDRVLAVDKPAGIAVIPGRGDIGEPLVRALEARAGRKLLVVHRLDREASGLVVFAKEPAFHRRLCAAFEGRRVAKSYWALVLGRVERDAAVDRPIRQFGSGRMGVDPRRGKRSVSRFHVESRLPAATLLRASPVTGRRHQLRVHLYHLGHPVIGDPVYGKDRPVGGAPRLMLHALSLEFPDLDLPRLSAPPGDDFLRVLKSFGGELPGTASRQG